MIEIRDDGRGMDREKILAKAAERGILDQNPEDMPDSEVYKLIFQPGFSTAETVTASIDCSPLPKERKSSDITPSAKPKTSTKPTVNPP